MVLELPLASGGKGAGRLPHHHHHHHDSGLSPSMDGGMRRHAARGARDARVGAARARADLEQVDHMPLLDHLHHCDLLLGTDRHAPRGSEPPPSASASAVRTAPGRPPVRAAAQVARAGRLCHPAVRAFLICSPMFCFWIFSLSRILIATRSFVSVFTAYLTLRAAQARG